MVISQNATKRFLERRLKNSAALKTKTAKEVQGAVDRLLGKAGDLFLLHGDKNRTHQNVGFVLGNRYPGYLFFMDPGLGKTKVVIDLFRYKREVSRIGHGLALVPNTSNIFAWGEELKKYGPDVQFKKLLGQRDTTNFPEGLYVATYMGLLSMVCDRSKGKMVVNASKLNRLASVFEFLVFDECTALMNHRSLTSTVCRKLAAKANFRYGLTGTPFGRDPADMWSQFRIIDHGETLGRTLGLFRSGFCSTKANYWSGWDDYIFKKAMKKDIRRMIRHRSIRYTAKECLDLPSVTRMVRTVPMSSEQQSMYAKVRKKYVDGLADLSRLQVKNIFIGMRQITAGFLNIKDEEGEVIKYEFDENPKLDLLVEQLREIPNGRKVVVFVYFNESMRLLKERLDKEDFGCAYIYSKTRQKDKVQRRFLESKKCKVLVGSEAIAYGLNLQVANYGYFYESPVSPILRIQAEKRIHRQGQRRRVFYTDLALTDTVDTTILEYLGQGRDLFDSVCSGGAEL